MKKIIYIEIYIFDGSAILISVENFKVKYSGWCFTMIYLYDIEQWHFELWDHSVCITLRQMHPLCHLCHFVISFIAIVPGKWVFLCTNGTWYFCYVTVQQVMASFYVQLNFFKT